MKQKAVTKKKSKAEKKKMEKSSEKGKKSKQTEDSDTPDLTDISGVGGATAEKLKEAGFDDLMAVAVATPGELSDTGGVSKSLARRMINFSRKNLDMGFESGTSVLEKRKNVVKISSGSDEFDEILGGGFETGCIVECFGQYGSGKTQVAHQLAVSVQKNNPDAVAVFVDTENTFRPERVKQIAEGSDMDPQKVLKNIKVARAFNSDHQMLLCEKISQLIKDDGLDVELVVVDSLTAHFRAEFIGRGTLAERQQKLNKHMHTLVELADTHNLAVYVTNQVMAKPDQFFGDPTEAIGGHIVGHNSAFRIYLRRGKKGTRVAKLIDSPSMPDAEAPFIITGSGIEDK